MSNWSLNEKRADISCNEKRRYVCVEYPGRVENVDKALKTIGGSDTLAKVYSNSAKRLALYYRPEDIYAKPAYGDRIAVTNLLMNVKKRKRKSDGKIEYNVEILGTVETAYRFQGMCDFQYMPMRTQPNGTYESIVDLIQINTLLDRQEYLTRAAPLYIPPLAFSRVDRPCDFLYRQNIEHRGQYNNPDLSRPPNLIGTVRQRRSIHTIFVNYGEPIPTTPIPEALKRLTADFVDPEGEKMIKKLLEEKPLWLKVELEHRTGYRGDKLKTFLPAMCFYWLDGPWRAQWNKIGYDPTQNVGAKIYQTIDFRIRQPKPGQMVVKAKRTDLRMSQWNTTARNQKHNVKIDLGALGEEAKPADTTPKSLSGNADKELFYKFKPNHVPPHRMIYYPAEYVLIEEVQQLLHQNDGKEKTCTEKDGWCVKDFNERAREHMYKYINRILQKEDPVELRFWRSKKTKRRNEMLRLDPDDEEYEEDEDSRSGPGSFTADNTDQLVPEMTGMSEDSPRLDDDEDGTRESNIPVQTPIDHDYLVSEVPDTGGESGEPMDEVDGETGKAEATDNENMEVSETVTDTT